MAAEDGKNDASTTNSLSILSERVVRIGPSEIKIVNRDRFLKHRVVPPKRMKSLHHRRQMRHVAPPDEARGIGQSGRMRAVGRPQQQGRGVYGSARHYK